MKSIFLCIFIFAVIQFDFFVQAQFGMKRKIPNPIETETTTSTNAINEQKEDTYFDDAELQAAIDMFANMSPQEMQDTIQELKLEFKDDPSMIKELDEILEELSQLDAEDFQENLESIMEEEAVAQAMAETLDMLRNADEGAWEKIMANKDLILDSVIESGVMSEEEIELFQNDPTAWEEELKHIWAELKQQASNSKDEL